MTARTAQKNAPVTAKRTHAASNKKEVPLNIVTNEKKDDDVLIEDDFDFNALFSTRKNKTTSGNDMLSSLLTIAPGIDELAVGKGMVIPIDTSKHKEAANPKRAFLMSIASKLGNLTKKGQVWAGKNIATLLTEHPTKGNVVALYRYEDLEEPVERKKIVRKAKVQETPVVAAVEASNTTATDETKEPVANEQETNETAETNAPVVTDDLVIFKEG